jgi:hypothetical protein
MLIEREQPEVRWVGVRCKSDTGDARAGSRQQQRQPRALETCVAGDQHSASGESRQVGR